MPEPEKTPITFTQLQALITKEQETRLELLSIITCALECEQGMYDTTSIPFLRTLKEYMLTVEELTNILKKEPLLIYLLKCG
jgi:hypothetical protein